MLQSFLDGELDATRRQQVIAHLEACRRCGLSASTYRELKAALEKLEPATDEEALARLQAFVDRLDEPGKEEPGDGAS